MSRSELLRLIHAHGLITDKDVRTLARNLGSESLATPEKVATWLVENGHLTRWQADRALAGKAGFHLGDYILIDRIAAGGMGVVLKAKHPELDSPVAIKVLSRAMVEKPEAVKRFEREITATLRLRHPHIVRSIDHGKTNGVPWLVMEFVDGYTLTELVRTRGPQPIPVACKIVYQAALGLQHAFLKQLVHRDLKPANILLSRIPGTRRITTRVSDFGLARLVDDASDETEITAAGQVFGTIDFISPEQARHAKSADIRSDIYSLACTLFFALTGDTPFDGETSMEKLAARLEGEPPPIRTLRPQIPRSLETLLMTALRKNPDHRYQTPEQFAKALKPFADGEIPEEIESIPGTPDSSQEVGDADAELDEFLVGLDPVRSVDSHADILQRRSESRFQLPIILGVVAILMAVTTWYVMSQSGIEGDTRQDTDQTISESWPPAGAEADFWWSADHESDIKFALRGDANRRRDGWIEFEGGSVIVPDVGEAFSDSCRRTSELLIEAVFETASVDQSGPARILTVSSGQADRNFTLAQDGRELILRLRTPQAGRNGTDPSTALCGLISGKVYHVVVTYTPGELRCFLNGRKVLVSDDVQGDFRNWEPFSLLMGDESDGGRAWKGRIERVLLGSRACTESEARARYHLVASSVPSLSGP